jgi:hypothetical protein
MEAAISRVAAWSSEGVTSIAGTEDAAGAWVE